MTLTGLYKITCNNGQNRFFLKKKKNLLPVSVC